MSSNTLSPAQTSWDRGFITDTRTGVSFDPSREISAVHDLVHRSDYQGVLRLRFCEIKDSNGMLILHVDSQNGQIAEYFTFVSSLGIKHTIWRGAIAERTYSRGIWEHLVEKHEYIKFYDPSALEKTKKIIQEYFPKNP